MTQHHKRSGRDDENAHGLGDVARRDAQSNYRDKFDTEQRTQNMPGDFGTARPPQPFDRDLHGKPYRPYAERYGEDTDREQMRGHRGRGPKNYTRSDQRILEDICERLWDADDVDASDVTVQVQDGVVTLRGNVEQRRIKHHIEDIVDACGGVTDIHNEIRVQPRDQ